MFEFFCNETHSSFILEMRYFFSDIGYYFKELKPEYLDHDLFLSSTYPFYFLIYAVCIAFVIKRDLREQETYAIHKSYLLSYTYIFLPHVIYGLLILHENYFFQESVHMIVFVIVWMFFNLLPYDIGFRIFGIKPIRKLMEFLLYFIQLRNIVIITRVIQIFDTYSFFIFPLVVFIPLSSPLVNCIISKIPIRGLEFEDITRNLLFAIAHFFLLLTGQKIDSKYSIIVRWFCLFVCFVIALLNDHFDPSGVRSIDVSGYLHRTGKDKFTNLLKPYRIEEKLFPFLCFDEIIPPILPDEHSDEDH